MSQVRVGAFNFYFATFFIPPNNNSLRRRAAVGLDFAERKFAKALVLKWPKSSNRCCLLRPLFARLSLPFGGLTFADAATRPAQTPTTEHNTACGTRGRGRINTNSSETPLCVRLAVTHHATLTCVLLNLFKKKRDFSKSEVSRTNLPPVTFTSDPPVPPHSAS